MFTVLLKLLGNSHKNGDQNTSLVFYHSRSNANVYTSLQIIKCIIQLLKQLFNAKYHYVEIVY